MSQLKEWGANIMKAIGIDTKSLKSMNPVLKWVGISIICALVVGVIFEAPKSAEQKRTEEATKNLRENNKNLDKPVLTNETKGEVKRVLPWVIIGSIVLAGILEPQEPKQDGRFKTGYKNNATIRRKSAGVKKFQIFAIGVAVTSGILLYFF